MHLPRIIESIEQTELEEVTGRLRELEAPMGVVIVGGLLTSTALNAQYDRGAVQPVRALEGASNS